MGVIGILWKNNGILNIPHKLGYTRPGKHTKSKLEHGPVEIVDLPINSMVIFHRYVSLPEGNENTLTYIEYNP